MSPSFSKVTVIVVLLVAIAGVIYIKGQQRHEPTRQETRQQERVVTPAETPAVPPAKVPVTAPILNPPAQRTARTSSPTPNTKSAKPEMSAKKPIPVKPAAPTIPPTPTAPVKPTRLPRLLELGADRCVPCKMMQPVLAELRQEYAGKLQVDFIDVWKDPEAGGKFGVQAIPTQILFDADGKELFRHLGFYPKKDIVAKFAEFGIAL